MVPFHKFQVKKVHILQKKDLEALNRVTTLICEVIVIGVGLATATVKQNYHIIMKELKNPESI